MAVATVQVKVQDAKEVSAVIDAAIVLLREIEHNGEVASWAESVTNLWSAIDQLQQKFPVKGNADGQ